MKKIYLFSTLIAGLFAFSSCNNEPDFPGLDEASQITNVAKYVTAYTGATFSEANPARNTLPEWLDKKYKTADKGSTAMVDYKFSIAIPEYVQAISGATPYTLDADDYQEVWGAGSALNYFSPSKQAENFLPGILTNAVADPAEGAIVVVNYNEAAEDGVEPAFSDDFESKTLDAWENIAMVNERKWDCKSYSGNFFAETTAYSGAVGSVDTYLITAQPVAITTGLVFSFDLAYRKINGNAGVTVFISSDLAGFTPTDIRNATWDNVTNNFAYDISGELMPAGELSMDAYAGQSVYIAFRYQGEKTTDTTTARIDNVVVKDAAQVPVDYTAKTSLYTYVDAVWKPLADVDVLQPADYTAMGVDYFTGTTAQAYLPSYLTQKYPLAALNTVKAVAFKLSDTAFMAAEFLKTATSWESTIGTTELTDEYEYNGSNWTYVRTVPKAALNMTFDDRVVTDKETAMIEGWLNVATIGEDYWKDRKYSSNNYIEATAYKSASSDKMEVWFITPALDIKSNYILTFDMVSGHSTHQSLEVYVSSSFSGEEEDVPVVYTEDDKAEALAGSGKKVEGWERLTESLDFPENTSGYSKFTNVGKASLDAYVGQSVYIAFRYWGNKEEGLTSTVQIDNVYVGE